MGLVPDSSVLIAAEQEKRAVRELLASLSAEPSETEFLLLSIPVMELEHGFHRAHTPEAGAKRRRYSMKCSRSSPWNRARVKWASSVPEPVDLLIGVTALRYGYAVGPRNLRHFNMIPGLQVLSLAPLSPLPFAPLSPRRKSPVPSKTFPG